jgi:hypothetical protein
VYIEAMLKVINLDVYIPLTETQHYMEKILKKWGIKIKHFSQQTGAAYILQWYIAFPQYCIQLQCRLIIKHYIPSAPVMLHFYSEVLTMMA